MTDVGVVEKSQVDYLISRYPLPVSEGFYFMKRARDRDSERMINNY